MPAQKTYDAIPSTLISECTITPPPTEVDLVYANKLFPVVKDIWEARFLVMYDAYMVQMGNLIDCDLQVGAIRSWDKQHLEIKDEPRKTID